MPNSLIAFYRGEQPDDQGRRIQDLLRWDHDRLEDTHDYIQWLFPTRQRSAFNPGAPVLDESVVDAFRAGPALRDALLAAFRVMLDFYGFRYDDAPGGRPSITPGDRWAERRANWLTPGNHNHLRITRILTSLRALDLAEQAAAFFAALDGVYRSPEGRAISRETYGFWKNAAAGA